MSAAESKEAISSTSSSQNFTSSSQNFTSSSQSITSSFQSFTSSSQSTCPYQNFIESVQYALSQLKMSHLKLKEEQEKVVRAIFEGKDVFVLLPTGFGKSVCFQVLPFVFDYKL